MKEFGALASLADILRPLGSLGAWLRQRVGIHPTWRHAHPRELAEKVSGDALSEHRSHSRCMYHGVSTAPRPFAEPVRLQSRHGRHSAIATRYRLSCSGI